MLPGTLALPSPPVWFWRLPRLDRPNILVKRQGREARESAESLPAARSRRESETLPPRAGKAENAKLFPPACPGQYLTGRGWQEMHARFVRASSTERKRERTNKCWSDSVFGKSLPAVRRGERRGLQPATARPPQTPLLSCCPVAQPSAGDWPAEEGHLGLTRCCRFLFLRREEKSGRGRRRLLGIAGAAPIPQVGLLSA